MTECPAHIRSLLARRVNTLEKLEAVIALRHVPDGIMSIADLATALQIPRDITRAVAVQLRAAGMLELLRDGRARLLTPVSDDRLVFEELVALYERDRPAVATAVAELTLERVRVAQERGE